MTTLKAIVQKHHKKADGTYNVKIRVTHNRVNKYIATPFFVTKDDLTKGLKIKNQSIADDLDEIIKRYRTACNDLGERVYGLDANQVVDYLKSYNGKEGFQLDFIQYGRDKVKELQRKGREGNAYTYTVMLNSLVAHTGKESIDISKINVSFLKNYMEWIETKPAAKNRVKGGRAPSLYLSNLRALHNMAKMDYNDEDAGIIRIPLSPFAKFKVPRAPIARKRALPVEDIDAIAKLPYTEIYQKGINRFNFAKDLFLLSFCLIGMNAADLFSCTDYRNGRITYQRTKTRNRREDMAEISIKVEPEVEALIEKYRDKTGKRVFNFYQLYVDTNVFSDAINKGLKKIGKVLSIEDLEFYAARHSWATIAINHVGIDKYTVHAALNHVDDKMRITDMYIAKDYRLIDEANRRVLDFVSLNI